MLAATMNTYLSAIHVAPCSVSHRFKFAAHCLEATVRRCDGSALLLNYACQAECVGRAEPAEAEQQHRAAGSIQPLLVVLLLHLPHLALHLALPLHLQSLILSSQLAVDAQCHGRRIDLTRACAHSSDTASSLNSRLWL